MTAVRRLPAVAVPLALAAVVLAGCGGDEGGGGAAAPVTGVTEVAAEDNHFSPAAIQVPAGTTVAWEFKDRFVPHDVTADGWSSGDPQREGPLRPYLRRARHLPLPLHPPRRHDRPGGRHTVMTTLPRARPVSR